MPMVLVNLSHSVFKEKEAPPSPPFFSYMCTLKKRRWNGMKLNHELHVLKHSLCCVMKQSHLRALLLCIFSFLVSV